MRYRCVRLWFRFFSKPWLDTDIPSKQFVCIQDVFKTTPRHVFETSSRQVFKTSSRRLQRNNFSSSRTSCRRLQDILKMCCKMSSRRIFKTSWKTKNCYAEDVLKTSSDMSWRRLQDVLKTDKCWLRCVWYCSTWEG